jgi:LPXTG-motif cell wall-anchored protein
MVKIVLKIISMIFIGVVSGIPGLVIGALIGGNFAEQFTFNGVRGYEASGQIGFILGVMVGLISGWWFLFKRKKG